VDRDAREEAVAAAVVGMEVRVDDNRDAIHQLVGQRVRVPLPLLLGVLVERRRRVDHPRVDEDEPVGMLDRVGESGQAVTFEDVLARQVPTDVVTTDQGLDSFLGGLLLPQAGLLIWRLALGDRMPISCSRDSRLSTSDVTLADTHRGAGTDGTRRR
jgi:hypothetical protein